MVHLGAHYRRSAEWSAQRGLTDDEPAERAVVTVEYLLSFHPRGNIAFDHVISDAGFTGPDEGTRVVFGLEQPGQAPRVPVVDAGSLRLEMDERGEPRWVSLFADPRVQALERARCP